MTIAEVSKRYGMTADTLRYYERVGLIPPVGKNAAGHRDYQETDLNWVEFIHCMRGAGVSIETLARYVELFHEGEATAAARKELLIEQRAEIENRIAELNRALSRLNWKIDAYDEIIRPLDEKLRKAPAEE